jgi:hypothetical protein
MSTTAPPVGDRPWSVADIEPVVCDLKATVGILGHLITTNSSPNNEVDDDAWRKVESDLIRLAGRADELWHTVWQQRCDEQRAHEVALAAARAEKAAPGSPEDVKSAKSMWRMVRVAMEQCLSYCNETEAQAKKAKPMSAFAGPQRATPRKAARKAAPQAPRQGCLTRRSPDLDGAALKRRCNRRRAF